VVNYKVNKAGLVDIVETLEQNIQGRRAKLDVYANEIFIQTLINREIVCGIASEENDEFITVEGSDNSHNNKYVVLIDPLDGSSNIDVNVSVGTIFSVYTRITPLGTPVTMDDFLQPGTSCCRICNLWNIYHDCLYNRIWCEWLYVKSCNWNILLVTS
jgi:fructose-1,6-bisphosphatase I